MLVGGAISWKSKKQRSVALSSMVATSEAMEDDVWLREFRASLEIADTAADLVTVYIVIITPR
jgi:hypothetical protein